jgi:hypothetical protein
MSAAAHNYGSVEDIVAAAGSDAAPTTGYDETKVYYLKENQRESFTCAQRVRRWLLTCVPIFVAVILLGTVTFFLIKNFSHLYPTSGGRSYDNSGSRVEDRSSSTAKVQTVRTSDSAAGQAPESASSKSSKSVTSSASCEDHAQCDKLGLIGACCPTDDNTFLLCCDD